MRTPIRIVIAGLVALVLSLAVAAGASAASSPSTPVHLSAAQVAQTLFVAGDVGRLSQIPSGTEDVVLEKVLQQLYTDNSTLAPSQAAAGIQSLQATLSSGSQAISSATLTVMAGNERILALLRVLSDSNPPSEVLHAIAQVTDQALTTSSQSAQFLGQAFDASADSLDTLSFTAFSPAGTLAQTAALAATNNLFGQARDTLWKQASSEGVFDSTQALLGEDPALQNAAINAFVSMLNSDGSLDTTVGQLESLINGGVQEIDDQNCTVVDGNVRDDAERLRLGRAPRRPTGRPELPERRRTTRRRTARSARNQAESDETGELDTINAQQAANAAEAGALGQADETLGAANDAEAQAAAQAADEENEYLNYQSYQQYEKAGFDVGDPGCVAGRCQRSTRSGR